VPVIGGDACGCPLPETAFTQVAELFVLHPLAVEDAVQTHQRPKPESCGDVLFAVFKTVTYVEDEQLTATDKIVDTGEIMAFIGRGLTTP
jgi:magnesium transporter